MVVDIVFKKLVPAVQIKERISDNVRDSLRFNTPQPHP